MYGAYYELLITRRSGTAGVDEGSHSFTCHPHVHPEVECTIPAFTPKPHSITALWLVLISRRRLSWPGWLDEILRWFTRPKTVTHPSMSHGGLESNSRVATVFSDNYLGCPKLTKRSQPLVGRSSPYCGPVGTCRRYCCITSFFSDCRLPALVAKI